MLVLVFGKFVKISWQVEYLKDVINLHENDFNLNIDSNICWDDIDFKVINIDP